MGKRTLAMLIGLVATIATVAAPSNAAASAATFSNPAPVASMALFNNTGPLLPYPSAISVAGLYGTITDAKVTLNGIAYGDVDELVVVVEGPTGAHVVLMSGNCDGLSTTSSPLTFTFTDSAPDVLPASPPCASGSFRPDPGKASSNTYLPAPAPPHATSFSALAGSPPNGLWQLWVGDAAIAVGGSITGGWTLDLTTTDPPASTSSKCKKKKKKGGKRAALAKKKRCKKKHKK